MAMKIWILFHEEEDAKTHPEFKSCLCLKEEAQKFGAEARILNPEHFDMIIDSAKNWQALYKGEVMPVPDLIIARTGTETTYAGFSLLRFYERIGVTVLNSWLSIESVADKFQTHQILASQGLPVPRTILGKFPTDVQMIEEKLGFPVVVKTLRGTRGGGVFLAETKQQFQNLTDLIAQANTNVHFLFQEYISKSCGRDLRVYVVGNRVVAVMQRQSTDGNFKANISLGGEGTAFIATPQITKLAINVTKALGLDVAGVDLLFDGDKFKVCEVNSAAALQRQSEICNVNIAREVIMYGLNKVKARRNQNFLSRFNILKAV
ncbi:MAG: RimK family alpha-L-glutamate ligase [Micavibrio sp.]